MNKNEFKLKIIDVVDGEIATIGEKIVYNTDNFLAANVWAKQPIKGLKTHDTVQVSSALAVKENNTRGSIFDGAIGYFYNNSNNVDKNTQNVALFSTAFVSGHGHGINEDNFDRVVTLFSARKLVEKNWINSKDEYLVPDTENEAWDEFVSDSVIYSIFHSASNQSSLRGVEYKGKKWDIKNEFFFMTAKEVADMANVNGYEDMYEESRKSADRFVCKWIGGHTLSAEAQAVLDKAKDIVRKTFVYRAMFNEENPNYGIMCFDAGWYQIRALAKQYAENDLKEFKELYKILSDKMRPQVYSLGFLK